MRREAVEEAGVILEGELEKVGQINFVWGPDWAKSKKQKKRYTQFQGEEMHFYRGKVKGLVKPEGDGVEQGWIGEVKMNPREIIKFIESEKKTEDMSEYRDFQLKMMREIIDGS